jgi:hypothetical protein
VGIPADATPEQPPVDVAGLVTCAPSISAPLPIVNGRRSYCSLGLLDDLVVLGVDTVEGQDPTTINAAQACQAPLHLGAQATDGGASPALSGEALDTLIAVLKYYQGVCGQLKVDDLVGAYATGWARRIPDAAAVKTAIMDRTGLALEVLTAEQEVLQRYLGTTRNRRRRLVVHARGTDLQAEVWPDGAAAPTTLTIAANLRAADAMYFSSPQVNTYQEARRRYQDALRAELDSRITDWRQQMFSQRIERSLTGDPDDATLALAVAGTLRDGNGTWDGVDVWRMKASAAPIMPAPLYGRSFGVLSFRDISRFVDSIDTAQFEQLRREPIRSAYGLQVMGLGAFFDVLVRSLPIDEAGLVPSGSSFGYLFRKRFSLQ